MSVNHFRIRETKERYAREDAADQERRLIPVKKELSANLQRVAKLAKLYWSMPLNRLAENIQDGLFEPDYGVTFPTTDEPQNTRGREVFEEFVATLPQRTGFVLDSGAGAQRLLFFCISQAMSQRADLTDPETWRIGFERLVALDAFALDAFELGFDESQRVVVPVVEAPAPEPTVADLETLNLSHSREDERKAKRIVSEAVFGPKGQAAEVYNGFIRHVAKHFGHQMSESEQKALVATMERRNLSFLGGGGAYDLARCELVSNGILPRTCLTPEEILSQEIEETPTHEQSDYAQRQNLKRQIAAARNRN